MTSIRNRYSNYLNKDEKPIKSFDVETYIQKEFLNADDLTFENIARLYKDLYGNGPYKYMLSSYSDWRNGYKGMSGQTMHRILLCVPKFLNDEKRFHILKSEIEYFLETIHYKFRKKEIHLLDLNQVYQDYYQQIQTFEEINLPWFAGPGVFSSDEIQELITVSKYAMTLKLIQSYRQICADLRLINEKVHNLKTGMFNAIYQISFLSSSVQLSRMKENNVFSPVVIPSPELKLTGKFKQFVEQYVINEFLKIDYIESEGKVNHYLKSLDLDFFVEKYNELLSNDQEAELKSEFNGQGGVLILTLKAKSIKKIRTLFLVSVAKILLYSGILYILVLLFIHFRVYKIEVLTFWGVLLGGGYYLGLVITELKKLKQLNIESKLYAK